MKKIINFKYLILFIIAFQSNAIAQNTQSQPFNLDNAFDSNTQNSDGTPISPLQKSQLEIKNFISKNAQLYGKLLDCNSNEAAYVGQCTNIVLHHWQIITGLPVPNDNNFSEEISSLWNDKSETSKNNNLNSNLNCKTILDEDFSSSMWKICSRPSASDNTQPDLKLQ